MSDIRKPGTYCDECMGGIFLLLIKEFAPLERRLEKIQQGSFRLHQSLPNVVAEFISAFGVNWASTSPAPTCTKSQAQNAKQHPRSVVRGFSLVLGDKSPNPLLG
jgi:hypothetical protein